MSDADRDTNTTGINLRAILWTGAAIVITLALAAFAAYVGWTIWLPAADREAPNAAMNFKVTQPVLESAPQDDRAAYTREKEKQLHSYGWVDAQAGIAHIPVEQAMRLMAGNAGAAVPDAESKR